VYQQRYTAGGTTVGGETLVNTRTLDIQYVPSITALVDGGWVISWTSGGQDGSANGIYQQRNAAAGETISGEILVNTFTDGDQGGPSVAAHADGGWLVTWGSYTPDDHTPAGIYQQRYTAAGHSTGPAVRVSVARPATTRLQRRSTMAAGSALGRAQAPETAQASSCNVCHQWKYGRRLNARQHNHDGYSKLADGHCAL
jgi:hypothetical protein